MIMQFTICDHYVVAQSFAWNSCILFFAGMLWSVSTNENAGFDRYITLSESTHCFWNENNKNNSHLSAKNSWHTCCLKQQKNIIVLSHCCRWPTMELKDFIFYEHSHVLDLTSHCLFPSWGVYHVYIYVLNFSHLPSSLAYLQWTILLLCRKVRCAIHAKC